MDADPLTGPDFARLRRAPCPPYEDLLAAAATEIDPGGPPALPALDDQARELFGVAALPAEDLAVRLAGTAFGTLGYGRGAGVRALLLGHVVRTRRGDPAVLAALLAGLGRRAGASTLVAACPSRWYAGVGDGRQVFLVETGLRHLASGDVPARPRSARPVCAHVLAAEVLARLGTALHAAGDHSRAQHAATLARALPEHRR